MNNPPPLRRSKRIALKRARERVEIAAQRNADAREHALERLGMDAHSNTTRTLLDFERNRNASGGRKRRTRKRRKRRKRRTRRMRRRRRTRRRRKRKSRKRE